MKIRKILVLLCTVILVASLAVGCTTDKEGEEIELVYAFWGNEGEVASTEAILKEYEALNPGIKMTPLHIPQTEYTEKILALAAAGDLPDTGMVIEQSILGWAKQGIMASDDIYANAEDKPLDYLAFKNEGQAVAYSAANEVLALWYNKDMFEAAGLEAPPATLDDAWTWEEFTEVAKLLTIDANGKNATEAGFDKNNVVQYGCYINQIAWQLEVWALSNGGRFFSADGKSIVFDDAAIEALQMVFDLYLDLGIGKMAPDQADSGFAYGVGSMNVAMSTEGQWAVGNHVAAGNHGDGDPWFPDLDYGVGVLPYMKTKTTIATGGATAAFAGSDHPEEAAAFVRWFMSPDRNFGTIEVGWWMPTLESWYTDADKLASWVDNNPARSAIGAEAYKTAIVDVALSDAVQQTCWYYTPNCDQVYAILGPAIMEAITGAKTAEEAIESVRAQMQAALDS